MATIVYTKANSTGISGGVNDMVDSSVRLLLEHENQKMSAKDRLCDVLFNVEDSQKYAEILATHSGFSTFKPAAEGAAAKDLTAKEVARNVVEHVQFMGEFAISANMTEDAGCGLGADARKLVKNFISSYYRTRDLLAESSLIYCRTPSMNFGSTTVSIKCPDGKPLICKEHALGAGKQTNYYYSERAAGQELSVELIQDYLNKLNVKMRCMYDENFDYLGYEADTIILPGDNPKLEKLVKQAVGSSYACGSDVNAVNTEYGKWKIVVLPHWGSANTDEFMVMSSEANRELGGNMFFNRVPLTVKSWEDYHTGNRMWTGRCRMSVGFGTYKHIIGFVSVENGMTLDEVATAL